MKTAEEYFEEVDQKANERFKMRNEAGLENDVQSNLEAYKYFMLQAMKGYATDCCVQTLINASDRIKESKEVNIFTKLLIRKTPPVTP